MAHQLGDQDNVDRLDGEVAAASHAVGVEGVAQHARPEGFAVVGRPDACRGHAFGLVGVNLDGVDNVVQTFLLAMLERAQAIIEAMPAASGYDSGLSDAMEARREEGSHAEGGRARSGGLCWVCEYPVGVPFVAQLTEANVCFQGPGLLELLEVPSGPPVDVVLWRNVGIDIREELVERLRENALEQIRVRGQHRVFRLFGLLVA